MKTANDLLQIAAKSSITVLIQGESGTGKEVAARFLHRAGPRPGGPFIAVNCGAIAKNLIESTLEGAKRGAYTGATADQIGVVRAAEGGTLFLDEIGELPYESQSRLLRILQERAVMPVGATRSIPVDFRLVCATNKNLKEEVVAGRFREDLYFRLNAFPVQLPALRERGDFEELAQKLWREARESVDATPANEGCEPREGSEPREALSATELARLRLCSWPGNIRQLKNVLQRYALLKPHGITLCEILGEEFAVPLCGEDNHNPVYRGATFRTPTPDWKIIERTLEKFRGNKMQTARALGISRSNLYNLIKKNEFGVPYKAMAQ